MKSQVKAKVKMSQETVLIFNITEAEDWTEEKGRKGTLTNPIVLPALSPDTEAKLMAGTVKTVKVKNSNSDRTIETLAKKIYERFQEKNNETFDVKTILEEENEIPQRVYDVLNIFEGLGLVSKEAGSFKSLGQDNMKSTLRKIQIDAEVNNVSSLLYTALKQGEVLKFPEQQEERSRNLKEFHLTVLTKKILKIFYSLEHLIDQQLRLVQGLTYQEVIDLLYHQGDEEKDKYSSIRVRVVRLLNTLFSLGLLSRVKGWMNKDLYRLVDTRVDVKVEVVVDVPEEIVVCEVNVNNLEETCYLMVSI